MLAEYILTTNHDLTNRSTSSRLQLGASPLYSGYSILQCGCFDLDGQGWCRASWRAWPWPLACSCHPSSSLVFIYSLSKTLCRNMSNLTNSSPCLQQANSLQCREGGAALIQGFLRWDSPTTPGSRNTEPACCTIWTVRFSHSSMTWESQ